MGTDHFVLSRLAFGADAAGREALSHFGFQRWLQEQLHPDDDADIVCRQRLKELKLRIQYPAGKDWPGTDEARPLQWLGAPIETLWLLARVQ